MFKTIALTALLALASGCAAGKTAPEAVSFSGPTISVSLETEPPRESGLAYLNSHSESKSSFVSRAGRNARQEKGMMYFKALDSRFRDGAAPTIKVSVDYFDEGKGAVLIKYDSCDKRAGENGDGLWKAKVVFSLKDTRAWRRASFVIDDARFSGRCNGGDFRLECKCGLAVSALEISAASQEDQRSSLKRIDERNASAKAPESFSLSMEEVLAKAKPYDGPSKPGTDPSTLYGKVMCGYQGWQNAPSDGAFCGWTHYVEHANFEPGDCHVDYWPDTSEMEPDEKYETPFRHQDGSMAYVFSPMNRKTVMRHFKWMEDAGIDGVFVQRFASGVKNPKFINKNNSVLLNVRAAANEHGRTYAVMYDLSGAKDANAIIEDWKSLVGKMGIGKDVNDKAYQRHKGKPVVALWGLAADREFCLDAFARLVDLMENDPVYGGFRVKLGTCGNWRLDESPNGKRVREIIEKADIVSPWTVGRYNSVEQAELYMQSVNMKDQDWCDAHGKDYMPVIFPGFSWHNMHDGATKLGAIPRLQGRFFWKQFVDAKNAGARMYYVAMFDEIDEGTAIYKCDPNPPVCPGTETEFLNFEGLPNDHYLWLAGQAGALLAGKIPPSELPPPRPGVKIDYKPLDKCLLPPGLKEISATFSNPQKCDGISLQEQGPECLNIPVVKAGRPGWMSSPVEGKDAMRKIYLKVEYSEFRGKKASKTTLVLDYFDEGEATVRVVYDSISGPWKEAGSFKLEGAGKWKSASFEIQDPLFIGRCNGEDLRIEITPGQDFVLGGAKMKKLD